MMPGEIRECLNGIEAAAGRYLGEVWQVTTAENRWLVPAAQRGIESLTAAAVSARFADQAFDKVFLLAVEPVGAQWRLSGREWDAILNELSPMQSREIADLRQLADELYRLAHDLFRPIAEIEHQEESEVVVRARGGALVPPDPQQVQFRSGQLLQPFYRSHARKDRPARVQTIPWTYLKVAAESETDIPGEISCQLLTGLRSPLRSRRQLRVDALAIALPVPSGATRLQLTSQAHAGKPMPGLDVEVLSDPEVPPRRLLSDRTGSVLLTANPQEPQVWLMIRSGNRLLARLPYVPGLQPEEQVSLPDDSIRLELEGDLAILQSELMDAVARRAVMMVRVRAAAHGGDREGTSRLRKELDELPGHQEFAPRLAAIRARAVQNARADNDKVAAARIEQICAETSRLIQRYLDRDKLRSLDEEIAEIQRTTATDAEQPPDTFR